MASQEYRILASGYRSTIALLSFSPSDGSIKVVSESPAPPSASWLEFDPCNQAGEGKVKVEGEEKRQGLYTISRPDRAAQGEEQVVYTISEDEEKGLGVSAVLKGDKVEITGQRGTRGAPAHLLVLQDGSGILIANYMGGNIIFLPTDDSGAIVPASSSPESIELKFDFPYSSGSAPNKERQDSSHPHQAIQASNGDIYICDLGSDRIWVISKTPSALELKGYLQAPPGAGPRHAVFSKDEKHLYVLTELTSEVLIYDLSTEDGGAAYPKHPMPEFKASIIPPNIPKSHSSKMDSAELLLHPSYPRTLFASNRLELHIAENEPHLDPLPKEATEGVKGDAVAIFTLSEDGKKVVQTKHVRTEADGIRGMQISTDGKYVALAGQQKGGVEIWQIGGENGEEWKRVAKNESIEQVTDLKWF